jgi:23S rRNA (guanosine2251-2'-O)-methyltransferase
MGAHGIVIPIKGGAQVNEDAIKTSAGALSHLPICREKSLVEAVEFLKDSGISIISCTEKSRNKIGSSDFKSPSAIVLGSEENGISEELISLSDQTGSIPMLGAIESLNVSVAAGMILYEAQSQRGSET